MTAVASWWTYVIRHEARETWRAMPGPWPVKVALLAVMFAIPGQLDEILFLAVLGAFRKRQARKTKTSSDEKTGAATITVELSTTCILPGQRREDTKMGTVTMWKPPPRREYKPKDMDPGQVVVWVVRTEGHYATPPKFENGQYTPGEGWVDPEWSERIGTIWSDGAAPSTWWVLPDDDMLNPVIVRRAGKKHSSQYREGEFFQSNEGNGWRDAVRRAENVRARGIYPVIEHTEPGQYSYSSGRNGADTHTVVWHTDPGCPDAAGKARYDGEGYARNYHGPDYVVWTPGDVARALMGLVQVGSSPTPFCARCIMLDTALRSQHSCASVTA